MYLFQNQTIAISTPSQNALFTKKSNVQNLVISRQKMSSYVLLKHSTKKVSSMLKMQRLLSVNFFLFRKLRFTIIYVKFDNHDPSKNKPDHILTKKISRILSKRQNSGDFCLLKFIQLKANTTTLFKSVNKSIFKNT